MNTATPVKFMNYQKKIMPYLDGTLSAEETSEFEAFVLTHPEFESQIKNKQNEIQLMRSLIPTAAIDKESMDSLDTEIRQSVYNLLKVEPKNFWESVKISVEEWISR